MSLQIGRVGIDVAANSPDTWNESGDDVTISGTLFASSAANVKALRQQLLGLVNNPDEKCVPVVWSEDTTRNGYYRVTAASVAIAPTSFSGGYLPFQVSMTRVQGFAAPQAEMIYRGADRVGKPAGVTSSAWVGVPQAWAAVSMSPALTSATIYSRAGERGTVNIHNQAGSAIYSTTGAAFAAPADWYNGAATITVDGAVVAGRQCNQSTTWTLDNGLLKVTPNGFGFTLAASIGSGWLTGSSIAPFDNGSVLTFGSNFTGPTILRNSPEECALRFIVQANSGSSQAGIYQVDLTLHRGARVASIRIVCTASLNTAFIGVKCSTAQAMTHIDANLGGNVASSFDANGNKILLLSPSAFSEDLLNGSIYNATSTGAGGTTISVAAGVIRSGAPFNAAPDRATDLRDQYMAGVSETTNIVAR